LYKNVDSSPVKVLLDQFLSANPLSVVVLGAGIAAAFSRRGWGGQTGADQGAQPALFSAFAPHSYIVMVALLMLSSSSRPDLAAGLLPALFAIGACRLESLRSFPVRTALVSAVAAGFLALVPVGIPVLPPAQAAAYASFLGIVPKIEKGSPADLPQW